MALASLAKREMSGVSNKAKERMTRAASLADELGNLEKEIAAEYAAAAIKVATKPERAAALRAEILALYEDAAPEVPFVAEGARFVAMLSVQTNVTKITNMAKIAKLLGREKFMTLATVTLAVLRRELAPSDLAACTKTSRSGPRTLSVVERGIAA
jgi:hypothetical protein